MKLKHLVLASTVVLCSVGFAQDVAHNKKDGGYNFTTIKDNQATEVKNQNRTGTCWSFSTISFFESELIRMGKGEHNLSEMFVVRNAYIGKAENFLRMYGKFQFGEGGATHDIPWVMRRYGIVPQSAYNGLEYGSETHNHSEMVAMLEAMVKELDRKPLGKLSPSWKKAFTGVLDAYLGDLPDDVEEFKFEYQGKEYTPKSFQKELGLDMDDYVSLTSFTHHPFYEEFVIEVADNWALGSSYNLPIDELMTVMEHSVKEGYTFSWCSDVSEKGFSFGNGLAIVPENESTMSKKAVEDKTSAYDAPVAEKEITQENRQIAFDEQTTTDDHLMHVVGLVEDQNKDKYFLVKNSWGTDRNECDGYFYSSMPYMAYKTINILVHKDALPKDIKKKLGL